MSKSRMIVNISNVKSWISPAQVVKELHNIHNWILFIAHRNPVNNSVESLSKLEFKSFKIKIIMFVNEKVKKFVITFLNALGNMVFKFLVYETIITILVHFYLWSTLSLIFLLILFEFKWFFLILSVYKRQLISRTSVVCLGLYWKKLQKWSQSPYSVSSYLLVVRLNKLMFKQSFNNLIICS